MTLHNLIEKSARQGLMLQREDGSMPPGHNGPYHDLETPARNTSHWLIVFQKAHELTGDPSYQQAATKAVAYLLSEDARPQHASFWHRTNSKKDASNGLIGQAWTLEALATAAEGLGRSELNRIAEEVFLLHPFDERTDLWDRVEVDGRNIGVDPTFNHQLWFAAAGALIAVHGNEVIHERVLSFMDNIEAHLALYPSGLIRHRHPQTLESPNTNEEQWHYRSIGYHAFNLYAFALLYPKLPDHTFWQSETFQALWAYTQTDSYKKALEGNKYGFPYNPVGFEVAFALESFAGSATGNVKEMQVSWLSEQVRHSFDVETGLMNRQTEDAMTHAARLYEATRLPNLPIHV